MLPLIRPGSSVALGEPEREPLARSEGADQGVVGGRSNLALAVAAAEAFLGRPVDPHVAEAVALPGRLEQRGEAPLELWDGAHNMAGIGWLPPRLPARGDGWVIVTSILADKKAGEMLRALSVVSDEIVVTESSSGRVLPAAELAGLAQGKFDRVHVEADPGRALERARELAGTAGAVLVTGSLYLLTDLYKEEHVRWRTSATG